MANTAIVKPQPGDEITSAWGTTVAEAHNGIQTGQVTLPLSAINLVQQTVTFPRPYAAPPSVVAVAHSIGISGSPIVLQGAVTATTVVIGVIPNAGGNLPASGSCLVSWHAIGVLA